MKIENKIEFKQIAYNNSSNIDVKDFINLYKKCIAKPYSFLLVDATLASDNHLRSFQRKSFRKSIKSTHDN